MDFWFFFNSVLLGVGLAMDAFSVSLANGLHEPHMKKRRMFLISGTFAFFQALMPMAGWICVHTVLEKFEAFEKFIPWIALALLAPHAARLDSSTALDYEAFKKKFDQIRPSESVVTKVITLKSILQYMFALPMPGDKVLVQFIINADGTFRFAYGELQDKDGNVKENKHGQKAATDSVFTPEKLMEYIYK